MKEEYFTLLSPLALLLHIQVVNVRIGNGSLKICVSALEMTCLLWENTVRERKFDTFYKHNTWI